MSIVMTAQGMQSFLDEVFPQIKGEFHLDRLTDDETVMRLSTAERHLRPGGTISGPTMFGLADVTAYVATLARIGPKALAVTTHCSIDFMRKPVADKDLLAIGRVLKLGRSLSVVDVKLQSVGQSDLVAAASLTYSIPPERS